MTWERSGGRPTGPITPALIRDEVLFTSVRSWSGRHGYLQEEVDDFLDHVANHVERLHRNITALQNEATELRMRLPDEVGPTLIEGR